MDGRKKSVEEGFEGRRGKGRKEGMMEGRERGMEGVVKRGREENRGLKEGGRKVEQWKGEGGKEMMSEESKGWIDGWISGWMGGSERLGRKGMEGEGRKDGRMDE